MNAGTPVWPPRADTGHDHEQPPLWTELNPIDHEPGNVLPLRPVPEPEWALRAWLDCDPDASDDDLDLAACGRPRVVTATVKGDLL